jgi:hypothetical protein
MIRLDLRYGREQSLWVDLKIILLTIPSLISQARDTRRARHARAEVPQPSQDDSPVTAPKPDLPAVEKPETRIVLDNRSSNPPQAGWHKDSWEIFIERLNELKQRSASSGGAGTVENLPET